MELSVLNTSGKTTGKTIALSDEIFAVEPNDHAIYLDVKQFLANKRQGTHKAKERNEVSGTTKKFKKQKGTGGARHGSMKSPLFVGGGRVFGPRPRDYSFKLNKKVKSLARKSALSYKAKESNISIVEDFSYEIPQTKKYIDLLNSLSIGDSKSLLVIADSNTNVYLSSRNLPKANVIAAQDLNTYHVLNAEKLIFTESSVKLVQEILA